MAVTRKFIDWNLPALVAVVDDLREQYTVLGSCDLSNVIAVLPGRQAGRRFLELLTSRTSGQTSPPQIITEGKLPELLYQPKRPFASELTQRLAWGEALRSISREKLQTLVRQPPEELDVDAWLSLGELLARQHRELAADKLSFADVASLGASLEGFTESDRWTILREVQAAYLARLDELELWDQQTARLVAIERHECQSRRDIVLIGTVNINGTLRAMLSQVADRVTTYIHAPRSLQKRFDELGCLVAEAWESAAIDLETSQVRVVDSPADQADAVARVLAEYNGHFAADEITVGVPDERIVPHIRRLLAQCGVPTRWVIERTLPHTEPYLFLEAVAELLETGRTQEFTALVRHPDMTAWINEQAPPEQWLTSLDEYIAGHLPSRLDEILGDDKHALAVQRIRELIEALLVPLRGGVRSLAEWSDTLTELLLSLYNHVEFDRESLSHRAILESCSQIREALVNHTRIPEPLMPTVSAAQAIRLTLAEVQAGIIPPDLADEAVQVYGWLELPLDDAAAAIVTSFNEGFVPSSVNHDLFLPNRLRTHLGLDDNSRRYARDAYALNALLHSRKQVTLIVGKHDVRGEPMTPSRLLFATDPKTIAQRVLAFYDAPPQPRPAPLAGPVTASRDRFEFAIPRPELRDKEPWGFSVTELATYLESPYRYYLSRVLKLRQVTDDVEELDPAGFGNLLHAVLNDFGLSKLRSSSDPLAIRHFLHESLERQVATTYGSYPLVPVRVQVEQARSRLSAFADWQAHWSGQGWELRFSELDPRPYPFKLPDGRTVKLRGRIDRIDFHPGKREWAVFDYKTGEGAKSPKTAHQLSDGGWINLQLPLYRHLARSVGVNGVVRLGYISLPRDTNDIREQFGDWDDRELAEADVVAAEVIANILDELFWPLKANENVYEFAPIVQDGVFGREIKS